MEDGEQLARRGGDPTIGRSSQEQTELRAEPLARDEAGEAAARDAATVERRQARSCHGKTFIFIFHMLCGEVTRVRAVIRPRSCRVPRELLYVITNVRVS